MSTVTIESSRFGTLEIAPEEIIEFPNGLIGLGGTQYTIVEAGNGGAFSWLHSIDDPSLALPSRTPGTSSASTSSTSPTPIRRRSRPIRPTWPCGSPSAPAPSWPTSTPTCARRSSIAEGKGHQVINESADAPVRAPLFPADVAAAA